MNEIRLVRPTVDLKDSFLEALTEFQNEGLPWLMHWKVDELRGNFEDFVQAERNKKTLWTKDAAVDQTELWAVLKGVYVGRIAIRHKLNADLLIIGGHISYEIRPSYRAQGIASHILKLALPIAKRLGIDEALLTCDDSNLPSIRVIEKNAGVLKETRQPYEGGPLKRYYWIRL